MKTNNLIIQWNQALSFSPLLAASRPAESVFWPGCAAMKLGNPLIRITYELLKQEISQLGFSSWCCGSPTFSIASDRQKNRRLAQLNDYFQRSGIKKVYTLCPNCQLTLSKANLTEAVSAWPFLANGWQKEAKKNIYTGLSERLYRLHDPCAARNDHKTHTAVRQMLNHSGINWVDFEHNQTQSHCCGRQNMLFLTDPAVSQKMLKARIAQAGQLPIVTYCESCVEAFRGAGTEAIHLLELLNDCYCRRSLFRRMITAHQEVHHA